jgi:hypothetical protein
MTIYVAHRLFAAHDRALATALAERLAAKVGAERVFLPFCDTDEEDLVAEVKGRRLFELDQERLSRLDAMIAVLHGPSLDDGVCMEIGYAAASGVPVLLLTTDFQTYSLTYDSAPLDFPDPLIQAVANRVIRVPRLGPPSSSLQQGATRYAEFLSRNLAQVDDATGDPQGQRSPLRREVTVRGSGERLPRPRLPGRRPRGGIGRAIHRR